MLNRLRQHNRNHNHLNISPAEIERRCLNLKQIRWPLTVWMIAIGIFTIHVTAALNGINGAPPVAFHLHKAFSSHIILIADIVATLMVIVSIWESPRWFMRRQRAILGLPFPLLFIYTAIFNSSLPVILVGAYPVFMIQTITATRNPRRTFLSVTSIYIIFAFIYASRIGLNHAFMAIGFFMFLLLLVLYYWQFYNQQVREKEKAEDLLAELQLAYSQVEESTVRAERQRVARELHDTLTQGLAGTIMQLEAAESFLKIGNGARGAEVLHTAIGIARDTLHESRITLTDLRSTTEESLPARLHLVSEAVRKNYGLQVTSAVKDVPPYAAATLTEISRIVSEALINVAKHAEVDTAIIRSQVVGKLFKLQIIDFGAGFDVQEAQKDPAKGHYGMQGLRERAATIDGTVTFTSTAGEGTTVTLTLPMPGPTQEELK